MVEMMGSELVEMTVERMAAVMVAMMAMMKVAATELM